MEYCTDKEIYFACDSCEAIYTFERWDDTLMTDSRNAMRYATRDGWNVSVHKDQCPDCIAEKG